MVHIPRKGSGLAKFGLLAGLWLAGTEFALAQDVSILPAPPAPPVSAVPAPPATLPPAAASTTAPATATPAPATPVVTEGAAPALTPGAAPAAAPGCDACKDEKPKSIFAKVPPIPAVPSRTGNFNIPWTGPGYYSALDFILGDCRKDPPKYPYMPFGIMPPGFFDANFKYLDDPNNTQHVWSDDLKRIKIGENWMFSTGGEFRWRYMDEQNARLRAIDNDYDLFRTRVYGDLWYRDIARLYVEYIDAQATGFELAPLVFDINRSDFLNLFIDLKVGEIEGQPVYLRGGRQELVIGSQRLISSLDWVNTRRTFEGLRLFRFGEKVDFNAFAVKPVTISPNRFDSVDDASLFTGIWGTIKPQKGQMIDLYALNLNLSDPSRLGQPQVPGSINIQAPVTYNLTTLGGRYVGDKDGRYLWDFEGMLQMGARGDADVFAYAYTGGLGYRFADAPMTPDTWVYFDYASGDGQGGRGGDYNTFNQLFPFGHYYFGFLDLVGRQNIQDLNFHLNFYPARWITGIMQFHNFWLANSHDALYNAGGLAIRRDPSGRAGRDVGQEIDLLFNFHLTQNQEFMVGYSKLFAGSFIEQTGNMNPDLFYVQYNFRW